MTVTELVSTTEDKNTFIQWSKNNIANRETVCPIIEKYQNVGVRCQSQPPTLNPRNFLYEIEYYLHKYIYGIVGLSQTFPICVIISKNYRWLNYDITYQGIKSLSTKVMFDS